MASRTLQRLRVLTRAVSTKANTPVLKVEPASALIDEPVTITVNGLQKHQKVTLSALLKNDRKEFLSCAHYTSNDNGHIDTTVQSSMGGSFTGLEPMGLFWSMVQSPRQRPGARLVKKDVTTPYNVTISVLTNHRDLSSVQSAHDILASTNVERWYMGKGVQRLPVREGRIRGALFIPEGVGPFPAILDMFGGSGGLFDFRAALLASRGYLTLSLAFLGYEDLPVYEDLEYTYFREAADWLSQHEKATPGGIGVIGVSFGGSMTYMLSTFLPRVRAAATLNAFPICPLNDQVIDGQLIKGHSLGYNLEDGYGFSHYTGLDEGSDILPFWRQGVKILAILGEGDLCTDVHLCRQLMKKVPGDKQENLETVSYPGAGHLLEPPYSPLHYETFVGLDPAFSYEKGFKVVWGGKPKPHSVAQEDSWKRILQHFDTHLRT